MSLPVGSRLAARILAISLACSAALGMSQADATATVIPIGDAPVAAAGSAATRSTGGALVPREVAGGAALSAAIVAAGANPGSGAASANTAVVARPYRVDLSGPGVFVAQTNFVQCVGASMQMMLNMIHRPLDTTAATQLRLENIARSLSPRRQDGIERQGASVVGWAAGLTLAGGGPYRVVGLDTIDEAMQVAAAAIGETGRPVGLLMWRGRHAWVMSGFEATADPTVAMGFRVTRAIVLDPLYPYGSSIWGPSPTPRDALTIAALGRQYVPRGLWHANDALPSSSDQVGATVGKYVLVLPYDPAPVHGLRIS